MDIPHGILNFTQFTKIYGTAITTAPDYGPSPYIDPGLITTGMALLVGTVAGKGAIRIVLGATVNPWLGGSLFLNG